MANKSSMSHFRIWMSRVSKLRGRFSRPPRTPTRSKGSFITRWASVGGSDGFTLWIIDRLLGKEAIGNGPLYFTVPLKGKCTDPICWSERLRRSMSSLIAGLRGQHWTKLTMEWGWCTCGLFFVKKKTFLACWTQSDGGPGPVPGLPKFAWTGTGPDLGQCTDGNFFWPQILGCASFCNTLWAGLTNPRDDRDLDVR